MNEQEQELNQKTKKNSNITKWAFIGMGIGLLVVGITKVSPDLFNQKPTITNTAIAIVKNSDTLNDKEKNGLIVGVSDDEPLPIPGAYNKSVVLLNHSGVSLEQLRKYKFMLETDDQDDKTVSPFLQEENDTVKAISKVYDPNNDKSNKAIVYSVNHGKELEIEISDYNDEVLASDKVKAE